VSGVVDAAEHLPLPRRSPVNLKGVSFSIFSSDRAVFFPPALDGEASLPLPRASLLGKSSHAFSASQDQRASSLLTRTIYILTLSLFFSDLVFARLISTLSILFYQFNRQTPSCFCGEMRAQLAFDFRSIQITLDSSSLLRRGGLNSWVLLLSSALRPTSPSLCILRDFTKILLPLT